MGRLFDPVPSGQVQITLKRSIGNLLTNCGLKEYAAMSLYDRSFALLNLFSLTHFTSSKDSNIRYFESRFELRFESTKLNNYP